ncbi:MAG: DNA topoisomerase III [Ruminococcaceae bacterium]|nr:DNA topoisomerase III [Oscillospiraceae bacterium]
MSKILVLAEKPSVGKELARVLGCRKPANGYITGDKYIVTWALGHLVTLADPEHYGKQYKSWRMEDLPMLPDKMALEVIPATKKQYSVVRGLLKSEEISSLVIATDAGREGELVARWIIQKAGFKKPIRRLWISSQTDKAIREGFAALKDGKEYENLYQSAQARAEADWLVGLNVTRALTCRYNARLTAGRVQTPTLAIIVERENAIRKFVPKDYYNVKADLGSFTVTYRDKNGHSAISDRETAEAIATAVKGKDFCLTSLTKTNKKTPPPNLYDLTELQRDANKLYGFSPKETLSIMQSLYERHKALTYPRTDSRHLTEDIVPTLTERVRAVSFGDFTPVASRILKEKRSISKSCINNAKVSDHHAIIPTEQGVNYLDLSDNERKMYRLVVLRFLTCFFDAYQYCSIKAEFSAGGHSFYATGREVLERGWKTVYDVADEEEEEEQLLPKLAEGAAFPCESVLIKSGKTTPPARYTEATLLSAMENPGAFIEDKKMREFIGSGLGTPATRADIIEKLFSSFYIEKSGKSIVPTSKGIQLINLVPADLKEPLLTAKWEQTLEAISKGKAGKKDFIDEIRGYTQSLVKTVATEEKRYVHDNITTTPCPVCGKMLLSVNGKKGKMLVCQDRECSYRQNVSLKTGVRCPNCHKTMELFGEGDKRTYICPCGYREKLAAYQKRRESAGEGASKHFVRNYLKQQKKEQTEEKTAMQLAFEKAMAAKKED